MRQVTIESLKKDEFFKVKQDSQIVYVKDNYNRELKKYDSFKFEDICSFRSFKKGTLVFVDFEF
jgi:hypothetical protein